jgi:SWI/SNF-related matrix-associated actin-dependent regulator of chromatin subfamily A member 5
VDGPHIWENSGKMMCLHKLLPRLRQQGSRVLIFCQMTRMIDILEDYMRYVGFAYCRIDGNTAGDERDAAVEEFNAPGSDKFCFLLSTRAGGLGLNLAVADIVILYDSDWNPQVDLQAMDRAHRIGQTKQVRVFRLITEQTVEEKIVERAERKLFLDAAVIQQGRLAAQNSKLSKGELMHMVRFGADAIMSAREGTITDEDIDTLLSRGQARTEAESAKIRENMQHNLASFSIAFEQGKEVNMFTFEGEDWSSRKGRRKQDEMAPVTFINLPQRARKRNYDVNEYFRGQLQTKERTKESTRARRKGVTVNDFQLFDREALQEIEEKESELHEAKQQQLAAIKELNAKKSNERRKIRRRERYAAQKEASQQRGDEESAEEDEGDISDEDEQGAAASSSAAATTTTPELQRLEQQIRELEDEINQGKFDLPPDLQKRKEELTANAFPDWTKRDFRVMGLCSFFLVWLSLHGMIANLLSRATGLHRFDGAQRTVRRGLDCARGCSGDREAC